jgi:nijmegen breakage syndrome protein 1
MQNAASFMDSLMEVDPHIQETGGSEAANPRKRPAPPPEEEEEEEVIDKLLPAAAAMKRRRIEEAKENQRNGVTSERSFDTAQKKSEPQKARKPRKELNIKEAVRGRREAEEEAARKDEEVLRDTLEGLTVEEMKNLAVIEEMELPKRSEQAQRRKLIGEVNSRWDERWNGRKNFKKFRRRGEGTQVRRGPTVIVPLEEVKKKGYGIGEEYWVETERTKKKRKEKDRNIHSQSQSQPFSTAKSEPIEIPSELAIDGELPESIDLEAPRTTRAHDRTEPNDESSNRSQLFNGKRLGSSYGNGAPAKKQKRFAVQDSDSDSEDELKFRFMKKAR